MSAYIVVGDGEPQFCSSNQGWGSFCAWIDTLDESSYPNLVHFRDHGWDEPASGLRADLAAALKSSPPPDHDTAHVAMEFAQIVAAAADDEVVIASNGVVAADGEEGGDEDEEEPEPDLMAELSDADLATFAARKDGDTWQTGDRIYTRSGGKTTWKSAKALPDDASGKKKGAAKPTKPSKVEPPAKLDPKAAADEIRAHLTGDPSKLTPAVVRDFAVKLNSLTVAQIVAIKKEHDVKGGKTKADHIASLLIKANGLKNKADADAAVPKFAGAIDYRHKDENAPVVKALRGNGTAEGALRAVLAAGGDVMAKVAAARKVIEDIDAAYKDALAKKDAGAAAELLTKRNAEAERLQGELATLREERRRAGLGALRSALKTADMPGVAATDLTKEYKTNDGNFVAVPLPPADTAAGAEVRAAIDRANAFIGGVLTGTKLSVSHGEAKGGRAFAAGKGKGHVIANPPAARGGVDPVTVHELGHAIEAQKPGATALAQAFLKYRTGDEKPTPLADKFGPGYGKEVGRKDDFERLFGKDSAHAYYCGKKYAGGDLSEILSLGLEFMYRDPYHFAQADPEYFQFVAHVLSMPGKK